MTNGNASLLTKIVSAVLVTVTLSGGVWVGTIQTRLAQAEEEIAKAEDDHDRIVRMDTEQKQIKKDVDELKQGQKAILDEIRKLGRDNAEGDSN